MKRTLLLIFGLLTLFNFARGQFPPYDYTVEITGPSTAIEGETKTYYADWRDAFGSAVLPPGGNYWWYAYNGNIISQYEMSITVQWTYVGYGQIDYEYYTWDNYYWASRGVTISNGSPPASSIGNPSNITANSFTANWSAVPNVTGYRLDVATSNTFSQASLLANYNNKPIGPSSLSDNVSGLDLGTSYYYRVRAENSYGTSPNSSTATAITPPQILSPINVTMNSFTARWNSATGATGYRLDVAEDINFNNLVGIYNSLPVTGTSRNVSGLSAGTPYYYRVRAVNGSSISANSEYYPVTTLDCSSVHYFNLYKYWPIGPLCQPQTATLRAEYYNGSPSTYGEFRLYNSETAPSPADYRNISYYENLYGDFNVSATNGATFWVSFYDQNNDCETYRMPYTFTVSSPPSLSQQYGRECGDGIARLQLSSNTSDVTFQLYRRNYDPTNGTDQYVLLNSNTTGYFEILDFYPPEDQDKYYAKAGHNGCFTPVYQQLWFDILPSTLPTISGNLSVCEGTSTTLTASGNGVNYKWFNSADNEVHQGSQFSVPTNLAPGQHTFSARAFNASGCLTNPAYAIVNVSGAPTVANAGPDQTGSETCGTTSVTLAGNSPAVGSGAWSIVSGTGSFVNATNPSTSFNGIAGSTNTLRWTITNGSCPSSYDDVTITFNQNPLVNAGPDQTGSSTCGLTTVTLAGNTPATGSGSWSIISGTGGSFGEPTVPASSFSGNSGSTYTLRWTVNNNVCISSDDVAITFNNSFSMCVNQNYIITNTILVEDITDPNTISNLTVDQNAQTIQYFDGLGRPMQTVVTQGSPGRKDIVQPIVYDQFGREAMKYLPYVSNQANGWYKQNAMSHQSDFYDPINPALKVAADVAPFALTVFEPSPLNRVLKQGAPGEVWQPNSDPYGFNDYTVKLRYEFNSATEVLLWTYDYSTHLPNAKNTSGEWIHYDANQLYANKTYDEENRLVIEYVDKQGRTVLKRVQAVPGTNPIINDTNYASTYYIYDDFGSLVVVLPPEAVKALTAN